MSKERRLGRGLAALLGTPDEESPDVPSVDSITPPHSGSTTVGPAISRMDGPEDPPDETSREILLSVSLIEENPFQPRREFGESEIASLAESLKEHDMLQPVLVRRVGARYQLISGERRLRAARAAGWKKIPARLRDADDRLVAELAIVENLQRKDLNPIEKALSFQRYLHEHQCTQEDLGHRLKIDRSTIANLLRLLELPPEIQRALQMGTITAGHARALLPLGDRHEQLRFSQQIVDEGLSVRAIERLVAEAIGRDKPDNGKFTAGQRPGSQSKSAGHIGSLEQDFRRALGTKVEIKTGTRGRGKIVVHFRNHAEFERLRDWIIDGHPSSPDGGASL